MTRMWLLPAKWLCMTHLNGEHKELHQLVGHIRNGNIEVVLGHAQDFQIDTSSIKSRHDELVREYERRGYHTVEEHNSPLYYQDNLNIGRTIPEINVEVLAHRCDECRKRIARYGGKNYVN